MSNSQKNNLNKALKIVRHPIFISHYNNKNKKNNKNRIIKTSEYSKTTDAVVKKPSILKYIKNNEISSAIKKKNGSIKHQNHLLSIKIKVLMKEQYHQILISILLIIIN